MFTLLIAYHRSGFYYYVLDAGFAYLVGWHIIVSQALVPTSNDDISCGWKSHTLTNILQNSLIKTHLGIFFLCSLFCWIFFLVKPENYFQLFYRSSAICWQNNCRAQRTDEKKHKKPLNSVQTKTAFTAHWERKCRHFCFRRFFTFWSQITFPRHFLSLQEVPSNHLVHWKSCSHKHCLVY